MDTNEIQTSRIRNFFTESAKKIIDSEGIKALTVRNIGKHSGYSFGTMYNHFKNQKELIHICIVDFLKDCKEFINNENLDTPNGKESLIAKSISFCNYFCKYPSRYAIIFTEQIKENAVNQDLIDEIMNFFDLIFGNDYLAITSSESINFEMFSERHKTLLIGAMNLYLLRRGKLDYQQFINFLKNILS